MRAIELIGKKAIRTKPVTLGRRDDFGGIFGMNRGEGESEYNYDYSYTSSPILIINATDSHIVYTYPEESLFGKDDKPHILDVRWNDDNWVPYDSLFIDPVDKELRDVFKGGASSA